MLSATVTDAAVCGGFAFCTFDAAVQGTAMPHTSLSASGNLINEMYQLENRAANVASYEKIRLYNW